MPGIEASSGFTELRRQEAASPKTLYAVDARCGAGSPVHDLDRLTEAALDAVALSSANEGTPVAVIEALAAGKPIVATAVGGTPEVVSDGQSGLLVPPANPRALACAIGKVLDSPSLAVQFGLNGRERVERDFALRAQIEKTVAVYRELTTGRLSRKSPSCEAGAHLKWSTALEKAQVSESSE